MYANGQCVNVAIFCERFVFLWKALALAIMSRGKKRKRADRNFIKASGAVRISRKHGVGQTRVIPYFVLLFAAVWFFCSAVYGDVFYMSQQTSFFAWDKTLMNSVLNQDFGWLNAAGRFVLESFHYPLFGGAVLALMLAVCAWLADYLMGNSNKTHWIAALLPFAFLGYFVSLDFSVNYMRETSVLMSAPLSVMTVLAATALVRRAVSHKRLPFFCGICVKDSAWADWIMYAVVLIGFVGITAFCLTKRENIIKTCRMQRLLEKSDWQAMIDEALSCSHPSRSIAAYYAVALAETGQLESRLFEIPYNFPKTTVVALDEKENDGVLIYSVDADFYAGLINCSYHSAMGTLVRRGPQVITLKRLAKAAVMNGESTLCRKYLEILKRCFFENAFVERYSVYADNPSAILDEPEFIHVAAKMPLENTLEQDYRTPYFIGYNVALRGNCTEEALKASVMACLYAKETSFLERVRLLSRSDLPPYAEQALTLQAMKDPSMLDGFSFDKGMNAARLERFIDDARPWLKNKETEKGFDELKRTWLNYYPFYLYFQNFSKKRESHEAEKGGVN